MRICKLATTAALAIAAGWAGEVPRPAQPLNLKTPSGESLSLESLRGKVVLVKFFLTECRHCQRTATTIMPIYREWRPRGLEVLGVAINPDAPQRIPEFRQRFGVTYPIALGDRSTLTTFADLSVVAQFFLPYIFMVDRQGIIRREHGGGDQAFYNAEDRNLREGLDGLLKQTRQARKANSKGSKKS